MAVAGKALGLNEEIQSVTLYNIRPLFFHGYVFPFVVLYSVWFYFTFVVYELNELGFIALAGIGLVQVLVSLFCLWFVHVYCALTCTKVGRL